MKVLTLAHLQNRMKVLLVQRGTQRAAANALGISQSHFCDILRGYRKPGPKMLAAMKLEEFTGYRTTGA